MQIVERGENLGCQDDEIVAPVVVVGIFCCFVTGFVLVVAHRQYH
jgi:hypothetical protein